MPVVPNLTNILPWVLYDRIVTAAAANTAARNTFFNLPIGAAGKTKEDTNLQQVMQLPAPEIMNVYTIGFGFMTDMVKVDIDAFLNDYYMEFWVGDRVYSEGPLQCFPSGTGLDGATTRNNEGCFNNGVAALGNAWDLRLPVGIPGADGITGIPILQGESFQVLVIGTPYALSAAAAPNNGSGLNLMCYLTGVKGRAVQG